MAQSIVERRLVGITARIKELREDLRVADEQLNHFDDIANDARIRAMVSETPLSDQDHRAAEKHADAMRRHRGVVQAEIAKLEATQDDLLDQLGG
jgi:uncharacterized protein (DUF3084 family)